MSRQTPRSLRLAPMAVVLAASLVACSGQRVPLTLWDLDAVIPPWPPPVEESEPSEPETYVVLLADADGKVGVVAVDAGGVTTTIDRAGQGVDLENPGETFEMSAAQIEAALGDLAAIEPLPPVGFVLYFPSGGTEITETSSEVWLQVVAALNARPTAEVRVEGHTDSAGSQEWNLRLAQARAEHIMTLLLDLGIDSEAIEVSAFGEEQPAVDREEDTSEALNRRVTIRIR